MTARATTRPHVEIAADGAVIRGDLDVPQGARAVVVFAHGSGSGRHSPRNQMVARALQQRGLGTLLVDLLTAEEEDAERLTRHLRFDIELLAGRLTAADSWLAGETDTTRLAIGYFGASTGAGAALVAAAKRPERVFAVVSRGGRPDLAGPHLAQVRAPTLLVVGGADDVVLRLNEEAASHMRGDRRIEIVPGATHLFEEPGALEEVARLAGDWFLSHAPPAA
jgi:dienelactone hydrolase